MHIHTYIHIEMANFISPSKYTEGLSPCHKIVLAMCYCTLIVCFLPLAILCTWSAGSSDLCIIQRERAPTHIHIHTYIVIRTYLNILLAEIFLRKGETDRYAYKFSVSFWFQILASKT